MELDDDAFATARRPWPDYGSRPPANHHATPGAQPGHPPPAWRLMAPTTQQWASIKDTFTQLYLGENRKLREVRDILSRRHGFHASEKMFKRRISEWKIRKNYKAKDKEVLARRIQAYVAAGHDVSSLSYHGRPVKLDRVKRHCRADNRYARLWEQLSHSPDMDTAATATTATSISVKEDTPSTSASRPLHAPSPSPGDTDHPMEDDEGSDSVCLPMEDEAESDRLHLSLRHEPGSDRLHLPMAVEPRGHDYAVQCAFFQTRAAVDWQFTAFTPLRPHELVQRFPAAIPRGVRDGQVDVVSAFWLALGHGFEYLDVGRARDAWRSFDKCCNMVQLMVAAAPLHLVVCVLLHLATPRAGRADLEQHLLGFVASMAARMLGPDHPLARMLTLIAAPDVRDHVVEAMMGLVVGAYSRRRKSGNASLFALRVDQIDLLRKRGQFGQAQALALQLVHESQSMPRKRYRTALAALGRLYADQHHDFAAQGVAHRILEDDTTDVVRADTGATTIWACDQLATACVARGDFAMAESYLRRATCISYHRYTHRGPSTWSFVRRLESCLLQQGKRVDMISVCAEMGLQMKNIRGRQLSH